MADYKIIVDSGCELPEQFRDDERFSLVPFRLEINGVPVRDAQGLNTKTLLERVIESKAFTNSACPSPDVFYNSIAEGTEKRIYLITISAKLSGCYVSAMIAKKLYEDKHDDKEIYVIDSKSLSGGEAQLAMLAYELEEQGICGEELKKKLIARRDQLRTLVIMNNLEAVYNNIKLPQFKEVLASASNVKSVLINEFNDEKEELKYCIKETFNQMADNLANVLKDASEQTRIIITHCNNIIGAETLRDMLIEKTGLKNFVIMNASGVNSIITDNGGMIVSF